MEKELSGNVEALEKGARIQWETMSEDVRSVLVIQLAVLNQEEVVERKDKRGRRRHD